MPKGIPLTKQERLIKHDEIFFSNLRHIIRTYCSEREYLMKELMKEVKDGRI